LPSDDSMKRLPFIKYMYKLAVQQSRQPKPMDAASILTFHDSVELFLHLSCRELGVNISTSLNFMQYWERLQKLPDGTSLGYKSEMESINTLRVNLKHQGINPPEFEIEASRVNVTNFFERYTPIIFNVNFDKITMTDLVQYAPARISLNEATTLREQGKFGEALIKIAIAFDQIIRDYKSRKESRYGRPPFFFGKSLEYYSSLTMGITDKKMKEFVDIVKSSIEPMQEAMEIMSLGLDYRRYVNFRLLVPRLDKIQSADGGITYLTAPPSQNHTEEQCHYCYDFVIDSAIRIQDFDFDIAKL
jgi:hypothetical protein